MTDTKIIILDKCLQEFALHGEAGVSIRLLADKADISSSVIYHYFPNKDLMLKEMFDTTAHQLGTFRSQLPSTNSAYEMLKQRIEFQLDHATEVLATLKYYINYRNQFQQNPHGYVPITAYKHIYEVLEAGIKSNEFNISNIDNDAKVITHAINGFILEYYPDIPEGDSKSELIALIYNFLIKALTNREEVKL